MMSVLFLIFIVGIRSGDPAAFSRIERISKL